MIGGNDSDRMFQHFQVGGLGASIYVVCKF